MAVVGGVRGGEVKGSRSTPRQTSRQAGGRKMKEPSRSRRESSKWLGILWRRRSALEKTGTEVRSRGLGK